MMKPNSTYTMNGVLINEKIIPDDMRWTNAKNAAAAGSAAGALYKQCQKLSGGTGKVRKISVHNTGDVENVQDDAERYVLATYNENMGLTRTQFYTDDIGGWQTLRAGTGLCPSDPEGSAEVNWCNGDNSDKNGGNWTSISIEIIMGESASADKKAADNAARIIAWLMWKHNLTIDDVVTHTYWVNKLAGKTFSDVDKQCTNIIYGKKWCPYYIFGSENPDIAYKNWKAFKAIIKGYFDELTAPVIPEVPTETIYRVQIGAFRSCENAENYLAEAKKKGFDGFVVRGDDDLLRVQIGAFYNRQNAEEYLANAKKKGFIDSYIVEVKPAKPVIKVGDTIKLRSGARDYNGGGLASFVYDNVYVVMQINCGVAPDYIVIGNGKDTTAAVKASDLITV